MEIKPAPGKTNCLQRLIELGVTFETVIDVGVLTGTPELVSAFPRAKHLLFEPMDIHLESIKKSYAQYDFELFNVACSDVDGDCYLIYSSATGTAETTHARISDQPMEVDLKNGIVGCKKIPQVRLDSLKLPLRKEVLLKVDVDGAELRVLTGADKLLAMAGGVIIEATMSAFLERLAFLSKYDFLLFDIVDPCYYHNTLSQVDLVFLSRELVANNKNLDPWKNKPFSFEQYVQYRA